MKRILSTIAILASTLSFSSVGAQEHPSDKGLSLALRLSGGEFRATDVTSDTKISDAGGGLALTVGYDFNPVFGLQVEFAGNGFSSLAPGLEAATGSVALLMQYRFLPGHITRPYLRAGLAGYGLTFRSDLGDVNANGGSVPLSAGVEFLVARHVALGLDVTHHIVAFDEVSVEVSDVGLAYDIDADGSQTNLSMSVLFYF
ncbi:MAG: porin family protein [Candidatus Krumholzibacteria bacterium]|nr:porin family protein [Candidatus Krumholzibacteria bacterium]MDH4338360.1 porin family protein [Candidatus Krumholzibacteria bacterium]MDH5269810.1 porin family protein [Candidatus Krumholzibacteria bacterium]MDH5627713.1 porin family protein [Candidatus Krumholzibacteria bacterium]